MFGTMIVQLPSIYEGGQLVVHHQNKVKEFDFSGRVGSFNFHYAAFYADCQHEIKPVNEGNRLCLVYNLVYSGCVNLAPANNSQMASTIASSIKKWASSCDMEPLMMVYLLEHQYCESSLTFNLLKGRDRAVSDVLLQAKKNFNFDIYLAQVNVSQNWSAEDEYSPDDLLDEDITADHLTSPDGHCVSSPLCLGREYMIPEDRFDELDPDEEEFNSYTGNEGATLDRQYHLTALLFWPPKNRPHSLGIRNMIELFQQQLSMQAGKKELVTAAKELVGACSCCNIPCARDFSAILECLVPIESQELILDLFKIISSSSSIHVDILTMESFRGNVLKIASKFGWSILMSPLQTIFRQLPMYSNSITVYTSFLNVLLHSEESKTQREVCCCLADAVVDVVMKIEDSSSQLNFVTELFICLLKLKSDKLSRSFVPTLCSKPKAFPVLTVLAPACQQLQKFLSGNKNTPFLDLVSYCISSLEASTRTAPVCPQHWSQSVALTCSCQDCKELVLFLQHPSQIQHRFKMGEQRRRHLQDQLRTKACTVTCTTERVGSPHTLVVTKTRAAYQKACVLHKKKVAMLSMLQGIAGKPSQPSAKPAQPAAKRPKVIDLTQ